MKKEEYFVLLLDYLQEENDWVTSEMLAAKLGKSIRTVKNYIKEINEKQSSTIIASKKGYLLNREREGKNKQVFAINSHRLDNQLYREQLILLHLLKKEAANLYDLAIELDINENTIKSDIKRLNDKVERHHIKIITKNNNIMMIGSEIDKNSFYSEQIYQDAGNMDLDEVKIEKLFKNLDVLKLSSELSKTLEKYDFFLDDSLQANILLHLCLIIETNKFSSNGKPTSRNVCEAANKRYREMSTEMVQKIESIFLINLSPYEKNEIYLLLLSKQKNLAPEEFDLNKNLQKEALKMIDLFEKFIKTNHGISIKENDFLFAIALHIDSLLMRIQTGYFIRNPLLSEIKTASPFIYDIAVSLCAIINKQFSVQLPEDEIGFVSLHLENIFIENQNHKKFKVGVFLQEGASIKLNLQRKLKKIFSEDFSLITFLSTLTAMKRDANEFDLILITSDFLLKTETPILKISPLLIETDEKNIAQMIETIKMGEKIKEFKEQFKKFTNERFFMKNTVLTNRNEVFRAVSDILINYKIVSNQFIDELNYRESLSSTAYDQVAIPHSFKMDALRSQLYIIVSEKPIIWNEKNLVNVVFVFAINQRDRNEFYNIFEVLAYLLAEKNLVNKLLKAKNYDEVIKVICE